MICYYFQNYFYYSLWQILLSSYGKNYEESDLPVFKALGGLLLPAIKLISCMLHVGYFKYLCFPPTYQPRNKRNNFLIKGLMLKKCRFSEIISIVLQNCKIKGAWLADWLTLNASVKMMYHRVILFFKLISTYVENF